MAVSYDTLTIEIGANVSNASQGIKTLKNNLNALQRAVSHIDTNSLTNVEKHLQKIANIDFSNVSKGLQDVVSAFKQMNGLANGKVKLPSIDPQQQAKAISIMTGAGQGWENYKPPLQMPKFEGAFIPELQGELGFDRAKESLAGIKVQAEQVKIAMDNTKKAVKNAGKEAEKSAKNGFNKIASAFKRILFYRIVRRLIQLIGQAIKEGIQNMALFDDNFNKSMSEIKSSMTYLKNSLASLVAPIVELVAPILTMFTDLFAEINNELGKMFAMLNGKNQFAKATKGAEDYAESLKKAQSVSLGIDELNIVKQEEASGFENENIEGGSNSIGELFANLKEKLEPLFEMFMESIKPLIEAIMNVFNAVSPILKIVIDLFTKLIGQTMGEVNKSIILFINMIASALEFVGTIMEGLEPILNEIVYFAGILINIFNESLSVLFEVLGDLFNVLNEIVGEIFSELAPVLKIISTVLHWLSDLGKGLIDFFKNTLEGLLKSLVKILELIKPVLDVLSGALGVDIEEKSTGERVVWGILTGGLSELGGAINKHANGGFVEDGLFMANHGELIGQFSNGKTAVANNEQITQGIYQAVLQAMQDSGALSGKNQDIVITLDGREIAKVVNNYNDNQGISKSLYRGGLKYGI